MGAAAKSTALVWIPLAGLTPGAAAQGEVEHTNPIVFLEKSYISP